MIDVNSLSFSDHDDRVGGQISYGNRTWRKDGSGSSGGGGGPKHVSFKVRKCSILLKFYGK